MLRGRRVAGLDRFAVLWDGVARVPVEAADVAMSHSVISRYHPRIDDCFASTCRMFGNNVHLARVIGAKT